MDDIELSALKKKIEEDPNVISLRLKLLNGLGESDRDADVHEWLMQCRWMIENFPTHRELAYVTWPKQLSSFQVLTIVDWWNVTIDRHPTEPSVVGMAGRFFMRDNKAQAVKLLKRAESLQPKNAGWSTDLLFAYTHIAESEDYREDLVSRVFDQGDIAVSKERSPGEKYGLLTHLVNFAIAANALSRGKVYANAKLNLAIKREISFRQFVAHNDLGLIAVKQKNISEAENELLLAAECEFFPSLTLAQELLKIGKREVVQKFLDRCSLEAEKNQFSAKYRSKLNQWSAELRSGMMPTLEFDYHNGI